MKALSYPVQRALAFGLIALLGAVECWYGRHMIYSDGTSYLELASLYARALQGEGGAWLAAVNSYWSPLISWLCALPIAAGVPEYWHIALLHGISYLALLATFWVLEALGQLLPEHAALVWLRWSILAWACFRMHSLRMVTPDQLATLVFLTAMLVAGRLWQRAEAPERPLLAALPLGGLLAFCYFAKTALLVVAPVTVLLLVLGRPWLRRTAILAALVFGVLISPWLLALQAKTGRFTFGDSGRLNYLWEVQGAARFLYPEGGANTVALRKAPVTVYQAKPLAGAAIGAYSPWVEPVRWYAGVQRPWQLSEQVAALWANGRLTVLMWLSGPGALLLFLAARRMQAAGHWPAFVQALWAQRLWLLACLAVLAGYQFVFVEGRYVAGAMVLLVLTPVSIAATLSGAAGRRLLQAGAVVTVAAYLWPVLLESVTFTWRDLRAGREMEPNPNYRIAEELHREGLKPGTPVAMVGMALNADWLRGARLQVVADLPARFQRHEDLQRAQAIDLEPLERFWALPAAEQEQILAEMARAGAAFAVADNVPEKVVPVGNVPRGWQLLQTRVPMFIGADRVFVRRLGNCAEGCCSAPCSMGAEPLQATASSQAGPTAGRARPTL